MGTGLVLMRLPLEAKRLDANHAAIYDANGMLIANMAGNEAAYDRAVALVDVFNSFWDKE